MDGLHRFLGGSPVVVLLKLAFLSFVVGIVMSGLGLTPFVLLTGLEAALHALVGLGLETVRDFGRTILFGAAIVVPLWLLSRLGQTRR